MNQEIAEWGPTLRYKSEVQALITYYGFSNLFVLNTKTQCRHSSTLTLCSMPLQILQTLVQTGPSPRAPARKSIEADVLTTQTVILLQDAICTEEWDSLIHIRLLYWLTGTLMLLVKEKKLWENLTIQTKRPKNDVYLLIQKFHFKKFILRK